jgi:hypothetical protein
MSDEHYSVEVRRLQAELRSVYAERDRLARDNTQMQEVFDLGYRRTREATELWRAQAPDERAFVMPDLGDLLQWLIRRGDEAIDGERTAQALLDRMWLAWTAAEPVLALATKLREEFGRLLMANRTEGAVLAVPWALVSDFDRAWTAYHTRGEALSRPSGTLKPLLLELLPDIQVSCQDPQCGDSTWDHECTARMAPNERLADRIVALLDRHGMGDLARDEWGRQEAALRVELARVERDLYRAHHPTVGGAGLVEQLTVAVPPPPGQDSDG